LILVDRPSGGTLWRGTFPAHCAMLEKDVTLVIQGLQDFAEVLALPMLFAPKMKTKQIPDDFRDWIEARTFEIAASIALPLRLPLDY
jgi:hypothetical protein